MQLNSNQSIYIKYSQNQSINIPFDEILKDFSMIKPTFNPLLDICTIKTLGSYTTNVTNFEKWKQSPNLTDEIINISNEYIDKNQDIINIIKKANSKYENPSYTISKVSYYISDKIKENLDMNKPSDVSLYFKIKNAYNNLLDQIKLKYNDMWNDIDIQYEKIAETLLENFAELENDLNFELTTETIESIDREASKEVEKLINRTAILIKENNILSPEIKIDFDKKMDQIYENVISSKNFDKMIHDIMIEMYGVEKAIHRMSLSFENCLNVLKSII